MNFAPKISYDQDVALARGRDIARANQRARVATKKAAERHATEEAQRVAEMCVPFHGWKNWDYSADYLSETRICRDCGLSETRPVRL